ncbi:MAG: chromate resistance protein ChrB domain-containing protein [Thermoplasmatota archaeon]
MHQPNPRGATWVTREHVFVDRVACPWLIRRFIDPAARFEFVAWDAQGATYDRAGKITFDMDGARFGHAKGADGRERCSFETLIDAFGLASPDRAAGERPGAVRAQAKPEHEPAHADAAALARVARVVRAADVDGAIDDEPEARGLKAISWGWRFNFLDDHDAIREGAKLYDALYTWAKVRDAQERDAAALAKLSSRERYEHLRAAVVGSGP